MVVCMMGKPAGLRITADRRVISADEEDLSFIKLEMVDAAGEVVPDAGSVVAFEVVDGRGRFW